MTWTAHTTVAAVIEARGRFLMVEEHTESGLVAFNQPAGHLDPNESLLDAVIRETREETGWKFLPAGVVGIYQWRVPPDGKTYLRFCFHGTCEDHHPDVPLDEGIIRAMWMTREELALQQPRLRSPMVLRCIDDYLSGVSHPLSILHSLGYE